MLRHLMRVLALVVCAGITYPASATTVTMNTDSAKAVLQAIQNPSLSHEEALSIARMHGNQGLIQKLVEFKVPATTERFAHALYAEAHGGKITGAAEESFYLDQVKQKLPQLLALVRQIDADPQAFQASIEQRISMFAPAHAPVRLNGYVVAAGDGGGYTFGSTDFFLNLLMSDDFVLAKSVTTHEMYHAVQGAYAAKREVDFKNSLVCENTEKLFGDLYEEGSATYVADTSTLRTSNSEVAKRILADLGSGSMHIRTSVTLLDLSVTGLEIADAMPFDDIYAVGFLGHGVLYDIGLVMAKAIAEEDGPQGLAAFLEQPPYRFVLHYTQLAKYGADAEHPKLGPNTIGAAQRLNSGCARP